MKIKKLLLTTTAFVTALCLQSNFAYSAKRSMDPVMGSSMKYSKGKLKQEVHSHSPLHINLWGFLDAQAGFRSQSSKHTKNFDGARAGITKNNRNVAFDTEGLVRAEVKGKTSKGLMYGANIDLAVDLNTGTSNDQNNNNNFAKMNRTFIYIEDHDMGRVEMGNKDGAAGSMLPTAGCVATATGGVSGDWAKYVVVSPRLLGTAPATPLAAGNALSTIIADDFHLNSGSLLDQQGTTPALAPIQKPRKLTYYSPVHSSGLQLGISYIPDAGNVKWSFNNETVQNAYTLGYKDGLSGGINWKYKMDKDNMVKIGLVGEYATVQKEAKQTFHKLGTVGIGGMHMYKEFSASASFNYLGKSGLRKVIPTGTAVPPAAGINNLKAKKGNYVATLGFAYDIDKKTKISLTGLLSQKWKNKFYNISLGAQYKLVPGLMPYAEVTYFHMKQKYRYVGQTSAFTSPASGNDNATNLEETGTNTSKQKNRGASFIIGTRIAF